MSSASGSSVGERTQTFELVYGQNIFDKEGLIRKAEKVALAGHSGRDVVIPVTAQLLSSLVRHGIVHQEEAVNGRNDLVLVDEAAMYKLYDKGNRYTYSWILNSDEGNKLELLVRHDARIRGDGNGVEIVASTGTTTNTPASDESQVRMIKALAETVPHLLPQVFLDMSANAGRKYVSWEDSGIHNLTTLNRVVANFAGRSTSVSKLMAERDGPFRSSKLFSFIGKDPYYISMSTAEKLADECHRLLKCYIEDLEGSLHNDSD